MVQCLLRYKTNVGVQNILRDLSFDLRKKWKVDNFLRRVDKTKFSPGRIFANKPIFSFGPIGIFVVYRLSLLANKQEFVKKLSFCWFNFGNSEIGPKLDGQADIEETLTEI